MLGNERIEVETVNMTIVSRSELEALIEVTYTDGGMVFHQSNCRAQQRIIDPEKTSRRDAIGTGLRPCHNCERPQKPSTQI
jgi:hypothetical protein